MKETEPTLLDQIKNDVAKERGYPDWYCMEQEMYGYEVREAMTIVCIGYADKCVKASLIKASEKARCIKVWGIGEPFFEVDKSSITDKENIVIL